MKDQYDIAIIGAGPGGYVAAIRAAQTGLAVALIESRDVGGTCLNRGCIPTKTLIHTADLYRELGHAADIGLVVEGLRCDRDRLYARKRAVAEQLRSGVEQLIKANKIDLFRGFGQIRADRDIIITGGDGNTAALKARHVVIATGSRPVMPPIPGIDLPGVVSSDQLLEALPDGCRRLTIIGGGVIGVEFASIFSSLGLEITLIEAMDRLLPTLDKEIGQNLGMILKRRGVNIQTGGRVSRIEETEGGLSCAYTVKDAEQTAQSDLILVAIGRTAQTEGLFSDGLAIETDRGAICVNERLETSIPGIYAIGDAVKGNIQLAHVASAQGINVIAHIREEPPEMDMAVIPACIYSDPEIATVGLTADEARARGMEVITGKYVMSGNGRSMIAMQERGFIKVVAEAGSERIIGAQLMCARAADMVAEFAAAIKNRLSVYDVSSVIKPHPTFCEGAGEALESIHGRAIHIAPPRANK